MAPIIATTDVDRPATEVFAYATEPTRFSEWQKGVVEGHMDEPGTPSVGAKCVTKRVSNDRPKRTNDSRFGVDAIDDDVEFVSVIDHAPKFPLVASRARAEQ